MSNSSLKLIKLIFDISTSFNLSNIYQIIKKIIKSDIDYNYTNYINQNQIKSLEIQNQ